MNEKYILILLIILLVVATIVLPAIYISKRETNAIKYCFDKYQNLEDIKTCKEIFYK